MLLRPISRLFFALLAAFMWMTGPVAVQEAKGWKATAGTVPIGEDPERPDAELFHVDYIKPGADPATCPVTFLVNGGPGGASIFVHIAAIGPLTVATPGDGTFPSVPAALEESPDSWIDFTDLVFNDPVDTGHLEEPVPSPPTSTVEGLDGPVARPAVSGRAGAAALGPGQRRSPPRDAAATARRSLRETLAMPP